MLPFQSICAVLARLILHSTCASFARIALHHFLVTSAFAQTPSVNRMATGTPSMIASLLPQVNNAASEIQSNRQNCSSKIAASPKQTASLYRECMICFTICTTVYLCRLLQGPSLCPVLWSWVKMSSMMRWNLQQKLPALLLAHLTDKQNQVSKLLLLPSQLSLQHQW